MRTTQEPDALGLRRIREHLHTLTLARLHIVFLSLFKPDILGEVREIHVAIRRVEAFLPVDKDTFQTGRLLPTRSEVRSPEEQSDRAFHVHRPRLRR